MIPTMYSEILVKGFREFAERQMSSQNVPEKTPEEKEKLIMRMVQSVSGRINFNEDGLE